MSFKAILAANAFYKISNVAVLFLTTAILSRAMGAEGYGLLSLLILNVALFNMLTSFGADSGITYSTALDSRNVNRIAGITFVVVLGQIILLLVAEAVCHVVIGHSLLLKQNNEFSRWMGVLFLIGISLQEKCAALLNGRHLYTQSNKVIFLCNLFSLLAFAFCFFVSKTKNLQVYLTLFVLSNVVLSLTLGLLSKWRLQFTFDFRFTRENLKLFFNYSLLVFITNLIQFLAYRSDLWIVAYYRNEMEVGWYALAIRLVQFLWILPVLFASIIFPRVSSEGDKYDDKELLSLLRLLNAGNVICGVLLFVFIKPLLILIFGQPYLSSVMAFQILLPGVILFGNATILAAYFAGVNDLKKNLLGSVLCFVCIVILDFLLIPKNGYIGAAVASSIGYSVTAFYFIWQYCKVRRTAIVLLFLPGKDDFSQMLTFGKKILFKNP